MCFLSCVCDAFVRVCLYVPFGHLLGKGLPSGTSLYRLLIIAPLLTLTKSNTNQSILLKEPFALKNSETVYFTSIFSTPIYSDIVPIDNFDLTFFYFYFVFEVFDTIQF